ncbi:MAG: alpha-ketoglutarate-dependent dioxygenase AlkB [Flavobacteriaceae bacterium]
MNLPLNCDVEYLNDFLTLQEANELFTELNDVLKTTRYAPETEDGKKHDVNFSKIMFLDQNLLDEERFPVELWGPTKLWTEKLKTVKEKIESFTNLTFKTCVLIYYPDGNSGVDFHSDFPAFGDTTIIPSVSLGEEREFLFREKESGIETSIALEHGSLTVMGEHCQDRYEHSLPTNSEYKNLRINLTFRRYGYQG